MLIKANGPKPSFKFHKFQQVTKQGKEMGTNQVSKF